MVYSYLETLSAIVQLTIPKAWRLQDILFDDTQQNKVSSLERRRWGRRRHRGLRMRLLGNGSVPSDCRRWSRTRNALGRCPARCLADSSGVPGPWSRRGRPLRRDSAPDPDRWPTAYNRDGPILADSPRHKPPLADRTLRPVRTSYMQSELEEW